MWFIMWLILVIFGIISRTCKGMIVRLYYFITRQNPFKNLGPVKNVVFVGGFLSFVPGETPFVHYWGALGPRVAWAPMIGPISSMSDRACELFYGIFGAEDTDTHIHYRHVIKSIDAAHDSEKLLYKPVKWWIRIMTFIGHFFEHDDPVDDIIKPKVAPESKSKKLCNSLTLVGHSAGGCTINTLLIMLALHHKYLVDNQYDVEDLPQSLTCELSESKVSEPVFVDKTNRPHLITPNSIKRIIYISSPLGGIEYACSGSQMTGQGYFLRWRLGWYVAYIAKLLDMFWGRTNGVIYDFFLEQFHDPSSFANGRDHVARDFIGPNQRSTTDRAMHIINAYDIKQIRVVTHASVPVRVLNRHINLLRPASTVLLYPFASLGCGWRCDQGESEDAAYGKNDGVVSVASQMYGHEGAKCNCSHNTIEASYKCSNCELWHIDVDHVEVIGTFGSTDKVTALWMRIFKDIAQGTEKNVTKGKQKNVLLC